MKMMRTQESGRSGYGVCILTLGLCIAASSSFPGQSLASSLCVKFGKLSYTAARTLQVGAETIHSKVYVMGDSERQEMVKGNRVEVWIMTPTEFVIFDTAAKRGIRTPTPAAPAKPPAADSLRVREQDSEGNKHLLIEAIDKPGKWIAVDDITCRPDGALLARKYRVPVDGKLIEATMTQNILSVGDVDKSLFTPPPDIQFQQPK
jgi:hypothetical protein